MAKAITHINVKSKDSFSQVPIPIGSSAQYVTATIINPETKEEQQTNLQALIDTGSLGGRMYWTDIFE